MSLIPMQWSIKLESGEIYMVQAEDSEALGLAIQEIRSKFLSKPTNLPNEKSTKEDEEMGYCNFHKVSMKQREGKYGKFYSHSIGTYPDLEWCNGK